MDFPKKVDIPSAWRGEFMQKHPDLWLWELDSHEIREIEKAAEQFIHNGESLGKISKENFALPNRGSKISKLQSKLRDGIGFTLVRGLPVEEYNAEQYSTIFCGIGSHIGGVRSQNAAGHLLGHTSCLFFLNLLREAAEERSRRGKNPSIIFLYLAGIKGF